MERLVSKGSVEDFLCSLKFRTDITIPEIDLELEYEKSNKNRIVIINKLEAMKRKLSKKPKENAD